MKKFIKDMQAAFKEWQENDGTKAGLLRLRGELPPAVSRLEK